MNYRLKKVAVLGSGIMGSGIACHLANVGMEVVMLDIVTPDLNDEKSKSIVERNKLVNSALQKTIKSKPAPLYHKSFASRIKTGNFEDDFQKIAESDWIIEVVVENLKIKKQIFQKVDNLHKACKNHKGDWYFTGNYPTPGGNKVVNQAFINFVEGKSARAY